MQDEKFQPSLKREGLDSSNLRILVKPSEEVATLRKACSNAPSRIILKRLEGCAFHTQWLGVGQNFRSKIDPRQVRSTFNCDKALKDVRSQLGNEPDDVLSDLAFNWDLKATQTDESVCMSLS